MLSDLPPVLTTGRLVLDPVRADDRAAIVALVGDLAVSRWLGRVPHPYRTADADRFFGLTPDGRYAIRPEPEMPLAGVISVSNSAEGWELGYWLGQPYWGAGYATEAGRAVVAAVLAVPRRPRLVSGYFEGNAASANVLGKLGFVETGRSPRTSLSLGHEVTRIDMAHAADMR